MATASARKSRFFHVLTALLALGVLGASARSAVAQYRYLPSRDYYRNDTAEGTVVGGALGAITGAIIGGSKNRGGGALIGAGIGALSGNLLGRNKDRADAQQTAAGTAAVANANRYAAAQAVTNVDLIRLTQAGVGDDVIVSTIRARGIRLDLSPQGIISLKENGVSDQVLVAAQRASQAPIVAGQPTIVTPAPRTVIVQPYPYGHPVYPQYYYRPHGYYHGGYHRARHGARLHVDF